MFCYQRAGGSNEKGVKPHFHVRLCKKQNVLLPIVAGLLLALRLFDKVLAHINFGCNFTRTALNLTNYYVFSYWWLFLSQRIKNFR
jgi:hypothetical protein